MAAPTGLYLPASGSTHQHAKRNDQSDVSSDSSQRSLLVARNAQNFHQGPPPPGPDSKPPPPPPDGYPTSNGPVPAHGSPSSDGDHQAPDRKKKSSSKKVIIGVAGAGLLYYLWKSSDDKKKAQTPASSGLKNTPGASFGLPSAPPLPQTAMQQQKVALLPGMAGCSNSPVYTGQGLTN